VAGAGKDSQDTKDAIYYGLFHVQINFLMAEAKLLTYPASRNMALN
jgi:hypothetical protein